MPKNHRDFVIFSENGVEHNSLVVFSQQVVTPRTQTTEAFSTEFVTLVYLKPGLPSVPSGDAIRTNVQIVHGVPPLAEGLARGWKDIDDTDSHELAFTAAIQWREYAAALENSIIADGHPNLVRIASDEIRTTPPTFGKEYGSYTEAWDKRTAEADPYGLKEMEQQSAAYVEPKPIFGNDIVSGPDGKTDIERGYKWGSEEHKAAISKIDPGPEFVAKDPALEPAKEGVPPAEPSAPAPPAA